MKNYLFDLSFATDIVGVDEVGRGSIAGPVLAVAYKLNSYDKNLSEVKDSKLLSSKKRKIIFDSLIHFGEYSIGIIDNQTIDKINILNSTVKAMQIACEKFSNQNNTFLIDGNFKISNLDEIQFNKR